MRILLILLVTLLASSCSWWPFGKTDTGNCMDDNSCDSSQPIDQASLSGTWHCYGVSRDAPWDCSAKADPSRIVAIGEEKAEPATFATTTPIQKLSAEERAEIMLGDETIAHRGTAAPTGNPVAETAASEPAAAGSMAAVTPAADQTPDTASRLFGFPDDSYAVQLIALQSVEEVLGYADRYGLTDPEFVRIESQGSDWYVLLLGVYSTLSEANNVADSWYADRTPDTRPWVRPTGPLKRAVMRAQSSDN